MKCPYCGQSFTVSAEAAPIPIPTSANPLPVLTLPSQADTASWENWQFWGV